jgi:hypothetical protein
MIGGAVAGAGWKGLVGVGQGFSVNAAELQAGSGQVSGLQSRCEVIAGDAAHTLTGMAGSVGHAGLASALSGAAGQGIKAFLVLGTAYGHVSSSLSASASNYTKTDQGIAGQVGLIFRGLR